MLYTILKPATNFITTLLFVFSFNILLSQDKFGGLALYTVRDAMNSDVKGTLKAVADAGYKYIEAAGYNNGKFYGLSPQEFKSVLDEVGLIPISSHNGTVNYDNVDAMITDMVTVGFKYFVIPVPPMGLFTVDMKTNSMGMKGGVENLVNILNTFGEKCNNAGLELLYHNHDFEFKQDKDGIVTMDYLLEHTNPEFVNFQMDLYWVTKAGKDPLYYFKQYPGRFKSWHVKDMDDQGHFAPVGNGHIDFTKLLAQKELSGLFYYFVEQDRTFGMTPFEAIRISHEGLKKIGFK